MKFGGTSVANLNRIKKVAQSLNDEIYSVFNSIDEFFTDSPNNDDW